MTGALAASLAGMVCALTLKGRPSEQQRSALEHAQRHALELKDRLLKLAVEDEAAYEGYRAAATLPKSSDTEKAARTIAVQAALVAAAEAPLSIARACLAILDELPQIAANGTKHVLSDAAASAILSDAALHSALLNVRVNAALIQNKDLAASLLTEATELETSAASKLAQALAVIAGRSAS